MLAMIAEFFRARYATYESGKLRLHLPLFFLHITSSATIRTQIPCGSATSINTPIVILIL